MDIQKRKRIIRLIIRILTAMSYILFAWTIFLLGAKFPELANPNNQTVNLISWVFAAVFVLLFLFMIFGEVKWGWQSDKPEDLYK